MASESTKTSSAFSHFRTIIIGVATTVIATLIVTKIVNSPGRAIKDATIQAWETTIRFENISIDNIRASLCSDDIENQLDDIVYEEDQLIKNFEIVKSKPNIDENLASFLTRLIAQEDEQKKYYQQYARDYHEIKNNNYLYDYEKKQKLDSLDKYYARKIDIVRARDEDAFSTIHKNLVDKYGDHFKSLHEKINLTESDLVGRWKEINIDKVFDIKRNHRFFMEINGREYPGDWSLNKDQLTLTFDDKSGSLYLHITETKSKYFRFKMNDETDERQLCRQ